MNDVVAFAVWVWRVEPTRALVGYFVAVVIGGVAVQAALVWMREQIAGRRLPRLAYRTRRVPPWFTGAVERLVFASAVWAGAPDALTGMLAWIALKIAANWQRAPHTDVPKSTTGRRRRIIRYGFAAIVASLVSMAFAGIGGYIARLNWPS